MKEISQYLFIAKLICKERIAGLDDSGEKDGWIPGGVSPGRGNVSF